MHKRLQGFTIVELLIVIVVIAILAAITVVAFNGVQDRARSARSDSDLSTLKKAVMTARLNTSKNLLQITGRGHSGGSCFVAENTYPGEFPKTHACWTVYLDDLTRIGNAANMNLDRLRDGDPWGAPYYIDENEGEDYASQGLCRMDVIGSFTNPLPATRDGYNLAAGLSGGYNWLRKPVTLQPGGPGC